MAKSMHEEAIKNLNIKADELLELIEKTPDRGLSVDGIRTDIPYFTLTEKDIVEIKDFSTRNLIGKTLTRNFVKNGTGYGLAVDNYSKLALVAEKVINQDRFKNTLSQDFVEKTLFDWLELRYTNQPLVKERFFEHLLIQERVHVQPMTVYFPIAHLVVQNSFDFCGAVITNISGDLISQIFDSEEDYEGKAEHEQSVRSEFQGRAAVKLTLVCEHIYARETGIETAHQITSLLGIYSGAVVVPQLKCVSRVKGSESTLQYTFIAQTAEEGTSIAEQLDDPQALIDWVLKDEEILKLKQLSMDRLSEIYVKNTPTEFETNVINMAYLYSKAAFSKEPTEKLVYILTALESILLRNDNEPIMQNLADRIALVVGNNPDERKEIVSNVKKVYGFRSASIHHGKSQEKINTIELFFKSAWMMYNILVLNSHKYKTRREFLAEIDKQKYS